MRRHKFGAVATVVDGHKFPSKAEAKRYQELRLLERAHRIQSLELQPRFPLHVEDVKIGEYRGDFRYIDVASGGIVIEDVKGVRTDMYRWKTKHLKAEYGITVTEITL